MAIMKDKKYSGNSNASNTKALVPYLKVIICGIVILLLLYVGAYFDTVNINDGVNTIAATNTVAATVATNDNSQSLDQSENSHQKDKKTATTTNRNQLYADSLYIKELNHKTFDAIATTVKVLSTTDTSTLQSQPYKFILFYSAWCPHCRHFVPTYTSLSTQYKDRHDIEFYSVDCVTYGAICSSMNIKGYPALKIKTPHNEKWKNIDANKNEIEHFITSIPTTTSVASVSASPPSATSTSSMTAYMEWLSMAISTSSSSTVSATDRLFDGLTSLHFLILSEGRRDFDSKKKETIIYILDVLSKLLNDDNKRKSRYIKSIQWMKGHNINYINSNWIEFENIILDNMNDSMTWYVCGIDHDNEDDGVTDPSRAYTCGLWMMMHYMTIRAEVVKVPIADVQSSIYMIVNDLFGCLPCRKHFISLYESCDYRCNIKGNDYAGLQLWLFHMHNSVTQKVNNNYLSAVATSSINSSKSIPATTSSDVGTIATYTNGDILWPSIKLCNACHHIMDYFDMKYDIKNVVISSTSPIYVAYMPTAWDDSNVVAYLKKSYLS